MAGIYIHIPFCKKACHYCDFHFSTSTKLVDELTDALVKEISSRKSYLEGESIETIYFGGGTPSMVSSHNLEKILNAIHKNFDTSSLLEQTIESNPDDLSISTIKEFHALGFNRLSIGNQSFQEDVLVFLNRSHNAKQSIESVYAAKSNGFENINIDLIYGIPHEQYSLEQDLEIVKTLEIKHVSAYGLTIEPKTVFGNWSDKGKLTVKNDEIYNQDFDMLIDGLAQLDIEQYEISNFAKAGFLSRHNTSYWKGKKYIGIGPSAHSYNGMSRQFNINNNARYIVGINEGKPVFEQEILTEENKINEYIMTNLRTKWGINMNHLKDVFRYNIAQKHELMIEALSKSEMITITNNHLYLTQKGKTFADKIASDFFIG